MDRQPEHQITPGRHRQERDGGQCGEIHQREDDYVRGFDGIPAAPHPEDIDAEGGAAEDRSPGQGHIPSGEKIARAAPLPYRPSSLCEPSLDKLETVFVGLAIDQHEIGPSPLPPIRGSSCSISPIAQRRASPRTGGPELRARAPRLIGSDRARGLALDSVHRRPRHPPPWRRYFSMIRATARWLLGLVHGTWCSVLVSLDLTREHIPEGDGRLKIQASGALFLPCPSRRHVLQEGLPERISRG